VPSADTAFSPLDQELELLAQQALTPRLQEYAVSFGITLTFAAAAAAMKQHHQVRISREQLRQHTYQVGRAYEQVQESPAILAQVERPEHVARMNFSIDAGKVGLVGGEWRDVKSLAIGVLDAAGEASQISYFSRMTDHQTFAQQAQGEVQRRGLRRARAVAAVSDGADWIQPVTTACRADAVRILDFYHAAEHLAEAGRACLGEDTQDFKAWFETARHDLRHHDPDRMLTTLAELAEQHPRQVELINAQQAYFTKRLNQIRYADFAAEHWPLGSGPVETAHKLILDPRLKGAGMRWHPDNLNPLLALRNLHVNDRWASDWPLALAHVRLRSQPARPPASLLPPGFTPQLAPAWRNLPVGRACLN
jgi:hypothetical protein